MLQRSEMTTRQKLQHCCSKADKAVAVITPQAAYSTSTPRAKPFEVDETFEFHGEVFRIRSGEIGKFADQAVFAFHGNTSVFNSLVYDKKFDEAMNDDPSFVPLTVEYREKDFAGGKIPSNFPRKETMSEHDILIGRKIDRALRPMLPRGLSREIQLLSTLYSYDYKNLPDVVALNGLLWHFRCRSATISYVAAVRVAYIPSQGFIAMPSAEEIAGVQWICFTRAHGMNAS